MTLEKAAIIEEIREELQAIADYESRLDRFKKKLKKFLVQLENEDDKKEDSDEENTD